MIPEKKGLGWVFRGNNLGPYLAMFGETKVMLTLLEITASGHKVQGQSEGGSRWTGVGGEREHLQIGSYLQSFLGRAFLERGFG